MIGEHSIYIKISLEEFLVSRVSANLAGYASGAELSGKSDYEIFDLKLADENAILQQAST